VASGFDVRVESQDGLQVEVVLIGDVDVTVSDRLYQALVEPLEADPPKRIDVDLAAVRLLDASAVGVLLAVRNRARSRGVQLRVRGATGLPRQVLDVCGVDKLLAGER
jgi:RNA polymerase sigma-B factor